MGSVYSTNSTTNNQHTLQISVAVGHKRISSSSLSHVSCLAFYHSAIFYRLSTGSRTAYFSISTTLYLILNSHLLIYLSLREPCMGRTRRCYHKKKPLKIISSEAFVFIRLYYYTYFTNFSPIGTTVLPAKSLIIMPPIIYHAAKAQIIRSIAARALSCGK